MSNKGVYKYMYSKNTNLIKAKQEQMQKYGIDLDKFNLMGEVYNEAAKNPSEISSEEEDKF